MLTLIIPTWNRADYLDKILESCAPLFLDNRISILVIDDGSSDNTKSVCKKYKDTYHDFNSLHHSINLGYAASFLDGIEKASSKWILMCEDDGLISSEEIQRVLNVISNVDADILVTNFLNANATPVRKCRDSNPTWANLRHAPGIIYRKEAIAPHIPKIREIKEDNLFVEYYPQIVSAMPCLENKRVMWLDATPCFQEFENSSNIGGSVPYWQTKSRVKQSRGALKVSQSKYFKEFARKSSVSVAFELSIQTSKEAIKEVAKRQGSPLLLMNSLVVTATSLVALLFAISSTRIAMWIR